MNMYDDIQRERLRGGMVVSTIEIRGVWLIVDPAKQADGQITVIVEQADGTLREAIVEDLPGPVSYYVHPAGIRTAKIFDPGEHSA